MALIRLMARLTALCTILLLVSVAITGRASAVDKVVVQLRWDHQFQFAGYYAAKWQGFYKGADLDVEIRSAFGSDGKYRNVLKEVASGRAEFGTGGVDILKAIDDGSQLTIISTILQRSPVAFYARAGSGISGVADFVGKRVATRGAGSMATVELKAMMKAENIDASSITLAKIQSKLGLFDLANGDADVVSGFTTSAGWVARERGLNLTRIMPSNYGIDFYGGALFTTTSTVMAKTDLVQRFVSASLSGWRYAFEHPEEIADRIATTLVRKIPVADPVGYNRFQSKIMQDLALYPVVTLGNTNPGRWRKMHEALRDAGLVTGAFQEDDVIFDPVRHSEIQADRIEYVVLLIVGLAAIAAAAGWMITVHLSLAARKRSEHAIYEAMEEAKRASLAKTMLLANVSHELRTPLNPIIGFAEVMEREILGPMSNETYKSYVSDIRVSATHLLDLINDFLDVSRIEAGQVSLEEEEFQLVTTVRDAVRMMEYATKAGNIWMQVNAEPGLPLMIGDRRRVHQVLSNVLSNAVKFSEQGEQIEISVRRTQAGGIEVSVRDHGIGMSAETQAKIFDAFHTSQGSYVGNAEGVGLGLFISRSIMEMHNGSIEVASQLGVGTTISLLFPASRISATA
jgi:signal transduction histidine kinase